jgi:hypothetical protein
MIVLALPFVITVQHKIIHAPGETGTRNPTKRSTSGCRLRPLGHWVGLSNDYVVESVLEKCLHRNLCC